MNDVLQAKLTILSNLASYGECGFSQVVYDCNGKGYGFDVIAVALKQLIKAGRVEEKLNEPLEQGDEPYFTYKINVSI